ncbi:3-deoxy-D-manno-octulosonic acid transferase [Enterovibrio paralichthyis]|uniref:3-deoxy-D-manno-octulosonic acid transferase n=1 Tax=Enterovibrio paralichthyis TaxID=2853805 RepID=UPI001C439805|nr:3-deoxy-D-manno-octulosonic acid transferase [Enterovibrio paralichthyis]MBV7298733.1 3-deoxy-D-manno-octulosonic acid transferase [Enterovibrio paralichthyis]
MNLNSFSRHATWMQSAGFFAGLLLAVLYASNQIITGDQTQMLYKGYLGAYQDTWLAFGNAASAVGNVPGSLSAWIVGFPIMLWDSPWSPMVAIIALRVISYLLFDAVIKAVFSMPVRVLFMVAYWLNPWLLYDSTIYNPAYLCFFTALHFWSAFNLRDKPAFGYSFLHVLAIGGAMQFHYSWPVLAVISCYLLYRKMAHPNWAGVITAGVVLLVSLIPYFQEYAVNEEISRESDRYIGYGAVHVYPVLKAVLYWFRYSSTLFSNRIITDVTFDWVTTISWLQTVLQYLWQAVLYLVGAATVVLSARINWASWKAIKPRIKRDTAIENNQQWLLLFAVATVLAIIVNAMLSPITFSYWHLILTFPLALIPLLVKAESWTQTMPERFAKGVLALAAFFLVVNLVASHDSNKYSYKVDYVEQVQQYLSDQGLTR